MTDPPCFRGTYIGNNLGVNRPQASVAKGEPGGSSSCPDLWRLRRATDGAAQQRGQSLRTSALGQTPYSYPPRDPDAVRRAPSLARKARELGELPVPRTENRRAAVALGNWQPCVLSRELFELRREMIERGLEA